MGGARLDSGSMSSANLSQQETAHRAQHVEIHSYAVDVDVRGAVDPDEALFPVTATLSLDRKSVV